MSKARAQSTTRKAKRVGNYSNITGKEIKNVPSSTKLSKHSSTLPTIFRNGRYEVILTKKEKLRREYLEKRKLKAAS